MSSSVFSSNTGKWNNCVHKQIRGGLNLFSIEEHTHPPTELDRRGREQTFKYFADKQICQVFGNYDQVICLVKGA